MWGVFSKRCLIPCHTAAKCRSFGKTIEKHAGNITNSTATNFHRENTGKLGRFADANSSFTLRKRKCVTPYVRNVADKNAFWIRHKISRCDVFRWHRWTGWCKFFLFIYLFLNQKQKTSNFREANFKGKSFARCAHDGTVLWQPFCSFAKKWNVCEVLKWFLYLFWNVEFLGKTWSLVVVFFHNGKIRFSSYAFVTHAIEFLCAK